MALSPLQYYPQTPSLGPSANPMKPRIRNTDWLRILVPMMGGLIPLGAFMMEDRGFDAEARLLFVTWGLVGATVAGFAVFQQIENEQQAQQPATTLGGARNAYGEYVHPLTGDPWLPG